MQHKPHLLLLANHYRGPGRSGGARTWHQVRELVRRFQVTLIIPHIDPLTQEHLSYEDLPKFDGMKLRIAPCLMGNRNSLLGRVLYQASSALGSVWKSLWIESPDVVLAMGAPPASALLGSLISRVRRVPLMLDVRDIPLETAEELGLIRQAWILRMARSFEAAIFRTADHIVCVSDEMAEFVCARGISPEKVSTNYIGYDNFEKTLVVTHELRSQLVEGLDPMTKFVVFYAGTLATLVDIPTVLQAAEKVKGDRRIGFVIVGDGERREVYLKQTKEKGLNIHFPGRVSKERVHELCAAADACVYPLQGGPATAAMLGNKVFDYLGAGKPIIYTGPDGAAARLIDHLGTGFVLPERDVDGLAQTVCDLSQDPEKFSKMGVKGKNAVIETMTAAHFARNLSEKLFAMISSSNGAYARKKVYK